MTTQQLLVLALMLSTIGSNVLTTDNLFTQGCDNQVNDVSLISALLHTTETRLDDIKIIDKPCDKFFYAVNTIGLLKKYQRDSSRDYALKQIATNNAIACGNDTILLNSTDINDCETLRNKYEEFKEYSYLQKKNNSNNVVESRE